MEDKFIGYRSTKLGLYIIFNEIYNDYSDEPFIFDITIIECLKETIEAFVERNILSLDMQNNIYNYLYQAREIYDEKRENRIELINEIIKIMNQSSVDNSMGFYKYELYKRQDDKRCLSYSGEQVAAEIDNIKKSICNDFLVFSAQNSIDTSDKEFIEEELQELVDDPMYYNTLNAFLYEQPILFKDLTFYNRTICVLDLKMEKYKNRSIKKLNKKFVKDIKKRTKNKKI